MKNNRLVEFLNSLLSKIPKFEDVFDEKSFYRLVYLVIAASILFVFLMVKVFKVRVREYPFNLPERAGWRDWKPANPFHFPWQQQKTRKRHSKGRRRIRSDE
uniref:Uncharacterized protein n=2 Tax=Meloidogyne TaxID=189290 RepID=A0A6V7WRD9_MELEN|nr:unnamed protein product [Meloidogyne enterolobii]